MSSLCTIILFNYLKPYSLIKAFKRITGKGKKGCLASPTCDIVCKWEQDPGVHSLVMEFMKATAQL